ncbi:MAG: FAD-dependent monooxygenase, partial [Gammaproteobacteria bacterium]|nr:FAD-dependent monooxygenase [Gammaproteobacteria bacterium]
FKNPYAVVHRADLHGVLLEACRSNDRVTLRTSSRVTSYDQDGDLVHARLEDGGTVAGVALIGADGLHSPVRAQLVGDGAPRVSGHATYRSVIPADRMPDDLKWNAATLWAGPRCHIVHYPLKGGEVFNLVVTYHRNMREAVAGKPVDPEEVSVGFEQIHPRARQVIEHGENWKLWVLCDRDPIVNWVAGRVTLLGDAAHPMLQYFAQGACMAMEDGVCLGYISY